MVLDVCGILLSRVRLGQGPNLCQSHGDFGRIADIFYGGEWYSGVSPLINRGVHEVLGIFTPLKVLFV